MTYTTCDRCGKKASRDTTVYPVQLTRLVDHAFYGDMCGKCFDALKALVDQFVGRR